MVKPGGAKQVGTVQSPIKGKSVVTVGGVGPENGGGAQLPPVDVPTLTKITFEPTSKIRNEFSVGLLPGVYLNSPDKPSQILTLKV
jgi:hypothetical protein